jgi:tetratricopeptide (TPR) repeat protein
MSSSVQSSCASKHSLSDARIPSVIGCLAPRVFVIQTTYVGRPETDPNRMSAMRQLGNGLSAAGCHEEALSVKEADLALMQRLGRPELQESLLAAQTNLAITYTSLGRDEEALQTERDVYSGRMKLNGNEHCSTLRAAMNYASSLLILQRFEEARSLLRKTIPVARRSLGESHNLTLKLRWNYAQTFSMVDGATLDDLRESVTTLEDVASISRRVFGSSHPITETMEASLQNARTALRHREMPSGKPSVHSP